MMDGLSRRKALEWTPEGLFPLLREAGQQYPDAAFTRVIARIPAAP